MRKLLFIFAAMLLGSIGLHAGTQITYKATERLSGYYGSLESGSTTFGPAITNHDFSNGKGTITCSGEITKIGTEAFIYCSGMSAITIPNSVTMIGESAFYGCSGLTSIEIPNSVTTIGERAFYECSGLTSITIPNSVTKIGNKAFYQCSGLTSVTIPNSVTTIGIEVFRECSSLKSIEIPSSVTSIGYGVFRNCTALTSVTVNWTNAQSIVSVDNDVFENIANKKGPQGATLYVPAGTFDLYKQTNVWKGFGKIIDPNNCKITYTASAQLSGAQFNPGSTTFGSAITKNTFSNGTGTIICNGEITQIGDYAFANCSDLTSIIIPNSVTKIGERAFWGCGLTSVTIPASVKEISFVAFKNCTQLKDLQFAERTDAIDIGTYVFENTALTAVDIPFWMKDIPEGLFYLNSKLETIYLSAFVRKINQKSFGGCTNLKCIVSLVETPPELVEGAFEGHDKDDKVIVCVPTSEATAAYRSSKWGEYFTKIYSYITYRQTSSNTVEVINAFPNNGKVEIPAMFSSLGTFYKVTGIADGAFYKEDSLVSISLPSGIQYIGNNAFNGCEKLKDINIEYIEDLQTIGDSAFYNCGALGSIVIPEGVQSLGKAAFMRCTNLTHISLPTGLKNIPDECFRLCPLGTEIIVPEGVETIGAYGFQSSYSSTETLITLPSTLKEIKNYAFANRTGLNKVICLADTPPNLGISIFYNQKTAIVYVPDRDAMKIYRDSSSWKNYKFTFADLMAEENKAYLYEVAGNNIEAQDTARHYCLLIDNAQSTAEVQNYTTIALERIDKLTLTDYKNALADSLDRYAQGNAEAQRIAGQYTPRIRDAYSRPAAEQLFTEAYMKITDIYELIKLKQNYKEQLIKLADNDQDLLKVATNYGALIDHAETKEEARELYERATMRMNINKQINYDWKGGSVKVNNHTCSTTKGYK